MSACSTRTVYGVAELLALVVSILRPWLDAYRSEFAAAPAKPAEAPLPGPQPRQDEAPQPAPEVPTAAPVVEQVAEVQAVQVEQVHQVEQLAEVPTADVQGLYVRRGEGHKVRYVAWDGSEAGHKYRRHVQPNGKATYRQAAPATYQHGQRGRNDP